MPPRQKPPQTPILDALQTSLIINRIDQPTQIAWTEWRTGLVVVGGTPAQAGDLAMLGPNGMFDPSVIPPTSGSTVEVNSVVIPSPNFNNTAPSAPVGFTNVIWQADPVTGIISAYYATSGTVVSFGQITSGTNVTADMQVGAGSTLGYDPSNPGVLNANEIGTINVAGNLPTHPGMVLISQPGNTAAVWADPQVQGLYPAGSSIASPPPYAPPTTIQPVLIGGETVDGNLENLPLNTAGTAVVVQDISEGVTLIRYSADTGPLSVSAPSTLFPLISISPQPGATSVVFILLGLDIMSVPAIGRWALYLNGTLGGGTNFQNYADSNMQVDTSSTTITGGRQLDSGFTYLSTRTNNYAVTFGFTGPTPDIITLAINGTIKGGTTNAGGALQWTENP